MATHRNRAKITFRPENKPLFALGVLLLVSFLGYRIHLLLRLSFNVQPPIAVAQIQAASLPKKILIPSTNINLEIFPTTINRNIWQIDSRGASFLFTSARPGQDGPIIIYAHNTRERFGPLKRINIDDAILVTDELGTTHQFQVEQVLTVSPDQVGSLLATEETLILYTCTGFLDQQRLVVRARPID